MRASGASVLTAMREKKAIDDEIEAGLKSAISDFMKL
jgi:hypothetical protein